MPVNNAPDFSLPAIPPRIAQRLDRGQRAAAYFAGSTALRNFLTLLGVTGYKSGITGRRNVNERITDLRKRRYCSIIAPVDDRESETMVAPLAHEWFLSPIDEHWAADCKDLVDQIPEASFENNVFYFRIPATLTIDDVDRRVKDLLQPRNLNEYLASKEGKERLRDAGFPEGARLFTDYDLIGQRRRSLASEVFVSAQVANCAFCLPPSAGRYRNSG